MVPSQVLGRFQARSGHRLRQRWATAKHWATLERMSDPLTASDFLPLILRLPHDERVRLAKLALRAAARSDSLPAAELAPLSPNDLLLEDEPLAWESEGWR
jgi:hypothetical protein